jgi:hypothetical protein
MFHLFSTGGFSEKRERGGYCFLKRWGWPVGKGNSQRDGKGLPIKIDIFKKSGEYLSKVGVKILAKKINQFTTVSNGAWLFINLPSGTYCLEASFKGEQKRISQVKIKKGSQKVLFLQW